MIALGFGIFFTIAGLLYQGSGRQTICAPENPGPLDELGMVMQYERGLPWQYYRHPLSKNCHLPSFDETAQERQAMVKAPHLLADLAVWTVVGTVIALVVRKKSRRKVR